MRQGRHRGCDSDERRRAGPSAWGVVARPLSRARRTSRHASGGRNRRADTKPEVAAAIRAPPARSAVPQGPAPPCRRSEGQARYGFHGTGARRVRGRLLLARLPAAPARRRAATRRTGCRSSRPTSSAIGASTTRSAQPGGACCGCGSTTTWTPPRRGSRGCSDQGEGSRASGLERRSFDAVSRVVPLAVQRR